MAKTRLTYSSETARVFLRYMGDDVDPRTNKFKSLNPQRCMKDLGYLIGAESDDPDQIHSVAMIRIVKLRKSIAKMQEELDMLTAIDTAIFGHNNEKEG